MRKIKQIKQIKKSTRFLLVFTIILVSTIYLPRLVNADDPIQDIIINSPTEGKEYSKIYPNHFPGTFSFEEADIGESQPEGFSVQMWTNCHGEVVDSIDGHNNVYRVYDNNGAGSAVLKQVFSDAGFTNPTYGTIEYYVRVTNTYYNTLMRFCYNTGLNDRVFDLTFNRNYFKYWDGSDHVLPNVGTPSANTWYRFKVDFRCDGADPYDSLGEGQFRVTINDIVGGVFSFGVYCEQLVMFTPLFTEWGPYGGQYAYVDAIGYSWDSNYNIGDNKYKLDGYYPATYGFENDEDGTLPDGWDVSTQPHANVEVIDELGGHNKVLECSSGSQTDSYLYVNNYFDPQTDGTIEWWWRKSSTQSSAGFFMLYSPTGENIIQLGMDWYAQPNTIFYIDSSGNRVHTTYSYSDDTWIHMRVAFDCSSDTWSLWIDGDLYLDTIAFKSGFTVDTAYKVMFWCYDGGNPTLYYVDAVGYSWDDTHYEIGDNLFPGILVDFDCATSLSSMHYTLSDGIQDVKSGDIYGDFVLPWLDSGTYQLTITGDDGVNLHQGQVSFQVSNQIGLTLPNGESTYTIGTSGYFPATFGFENDANGALPEGWDVSTQPHANVQVIDELGGHHKVLECSSGSETDSYLYVNNYFDPQTDGTIEWWWRKSSTQSSAGFFMLYSPTGENIIQLGMDWYSQPNTIFYIDASGNRVHTTYSYSDDTWIHMRVTFDCSSDTWSLWIDGDLYLDNIAFKSGFTVDTANKVMFWCYDGGNPTLYYVDAVGYSWDPNYYIGHNQREGVFIQVSKPIGINELYLHKDGLVSPVFGSFTFDLYDGGTHNIRIVGIDDHGAMCLSPKREFFCEPNGWNFQTVDGSIDVYFTDDSPSRLKFGIQYEYVFYQQPMIQLQVSLPSGNPSGSATIRLYVDDSEDYFYEDSKYFQVGDNLLEITQQLESLKTISWHQIIVELVSPNAENFKLDYLRIGKVCFSTLTITNRDYLYEKSSESLIWEGQSWDDDVVAIDFVPNPGAYFVFYTATYKLNYDPLNPFYPEDLDRVSIKFVVNGIEIYTSLRAYEPDEDYGLYETLTAVSTLYLPSSGVKARMFLGNYYDQMEICERSICAISFADGDQWSSSTNSLSWNDGNTVQDQDISTNRLTGEFFAIYTARFKIGDPSPDFTGKHCNGWAEFTHDTQAFSYSRRDWEVPAILFDSDERSSTILIGDKVQLSNEKLSVNLHLTQRDDERITIMERELILISLDFSHKYVKRGDSSENLNGIFETKNINFKAFTLYCSNNKLYDPDGDDLWYDNAECVGWTSFNDGIQQLEYSKRSYDVGYGYGSTIRKTIFLAEILNLVGRDIKVDYFFDAADNEIFTLELRSLLIIPFF